MKYQAPVLIFLLCMCALSGSTAAQEGGQAIPACTGQQITDLQAASQPYLDAFDEFLAFSSISGVDESIVQMEDLQRRWRADVMPALPNCAQSVEFQRLAAGTFDEMLIAILLAQTGHDELAAHHATAALAGWDQAESFAFVSPAAPGEAGTAPQPGVTVTATKDVNLRSGPGTNYPVNGMLHDGQTVNAIALDVTGEWVKVAPDAWVALWVMTMTGDPSSLPVLQPLPPSDPVPTPVGPTPVGPTLVPGGPTPVGPTPVGPSPVPGGPTLVGPTPVGPSPTVKPLPTKVPTATPVK